MFNKIEVKMTKDGSHTLMSSLFDDSYHAHNGAMSESEHVYIQAGFEQLDHEFAQVNILELGFGSGMNAILTLKSALAKTGNIERPIRFISIEAYPIPLDIVAQLNYKTGFSPQLAELFDKLHQAPWGCDVEIMPGFILHKVHAKLQDFTTDINSINLVFYDAFAPSKQPELWLQDNFDRLFPVMQQGGMLVSYCANGQFKRNLKAAGFRVKAYPGALGRREMTQAWK
ncbi:tRNA (5-methylaminomethyl-2-thiouridine)(34)-methyltransferase MnmD [Shewanella eurypsychrophilus]|uniref:tRNA (5-methylaminomethyl-2-thiouridine)(34)-methyltransferase MnmD n=1 Tax=Shewanella eurypsychrophilus TaxID=2593656 RepID=A0ABX6VBH7_9GAMM|nr:MULTISPECIES: tRNA (5-methylaminomethyl-2-thiouridine)(34)-methyltransferase MnmD [Shewanella]QFU24516.1 tRNA (5-methylaminomethyl-2-thiouridine)(34)-methyltransferase MnmD [Shewanella sp. YLB-09]QPG59714.1 tRNA (5-methylaminomethyl-2-thiouridine)(34)-methyltransferase MnmD [Shewanella eurypsychrophilus]